MDTLTVLGAGDLGATVARLAAERGLARRVVLVDEDEGRARGKALDLAQSGPVEGYDTSLEGAGAGPALGARDALVVAHETAAPDAAKRLAEAVRASAGEAVVVAAGRGAPALLQALVASGAKRERVLGSSPVAAAAALQRHVADELEVEPRSVSVTLLGVPPDRLVVPAGAVTLSGVPVEALSPAVLRRALARVAAGRGGPVAAAAAAVRVLSALDRTRPTVLPVLVSLDGAYGHRGVVSGVPARLGRGRVLGIVEVPLAPVDRVAFDNAASPRTHAG